MRRFLPGLAVCLATVLAADLPIREVVLYKSGVAYVHRSGPLRPGESARLDFRGSEMNDVLKSLVIDDRGGKVNGLRYDASEPLSQLLGTFPFRLEGASTVAAFLDQVKGARLELTLGGQTVVGVIVSARSFAVSDKSPEREQVVLLLDNGDLRTIDLSSASAMHFTDPELQAQLRAYLTAVAHSRSADKRSVYIDASDVKDRQIAASYMTPSAVWKSSYRLIFGASGQPTLEGWAIVDNTTGEDWNGVKLAVVSGRPISFISRLYEPKYVQRLTAELPEDQARGPVVYEGALGAGLGGAPPAAPMANAMKMQARASNRREADSFARQELTSSLAVDTGAHEVGDLFEYRFAAPVTVKKSESVMLPFLQDKLSARKLLIYSEGNGSHPMTAAELTNSTGKTLDGGPITVFDQGSYGGEALMETLKAGDKRLISYAVDLGTRITSAFDSEQIFVREAHARRGTLTTRSAIQETKAYTAFNVDARAKTLVIEHPSRQEYKVLNQKPVETTTNAYRFEVALGPNATVKFPVTEERLEQTTTAVSSMTPDVLLTWVQNKAVPAAVQQQFRAILDKKTAIAEAEANAQRLQTDINELVQDQNRIRQNLTSLNSVAGQQDQVQKYGRQLAAQEGRLATLRDQLQELRTRRAALESELHSMIGNLEF